MIASDSAIASTKRSSRRSPGCCRVSVVMARDATRAAYLRARPEAFRADGCATPEHSREKHAECSFYCVRNKIELDELRSHQLHLNLVRPGCGSSVPLCAHSGESHRAAHGAREACGCVPFCVPQPLQTALQSQGAAES